MNKTRMKKRYIRLDRLRHLAHYLSSCGEDSVIFSSETYHSVIGNGFVIRDGLSACIEAFPDHWCWMSFDQDGLTYYAPKLLDEEWIEVYGELTRTEQGSDWAVPISSAMIFFGLTEIEVYHLFRDDNSHSTKLPGLQSGTIFNSSEVQAEHLFLFCNGIEKMRPNYVYRPESNISEPPYFNSQDLDKNLRMGFKPFNLN